MKGCVRLTPKYISHSYRKIYINDARWSISGVPSRQNRHRNADWLAIPVGGPFPFHRKSSRKRTKKKARDRAISNLFVLSFLCPIGDLVVTLGRAWLGQHLVAQNWERKSEQMRVNIHKYIYIYIYAWKKLSMQKKNEIIYYILISRWDKEKRKQGKNE